MQSRIKQVLRLLVIGAGMMVMMGCSVFGNPGVEIAQYDVIERDNKIEVRYYPALILVSAPISENGDDRNSAFRMLFDYISGANRSNSKIAMTAPVVSDAKTEEEASVEMKDGQKIAMTAPVFMGKEKEGGKRMMSFVLPSEFSLETAPVPTNPDVVVSERRDMTQAVIRFSGLLREGNIRKNREKLERWIEQKQYTATGSPQTAGYNPPWTLPNLRRNEVLIPVRL